jgi:hypothetical protein
MPGARSSRTVMIIVAVVVIAGLVATMMLGVGTLPTR